MAGSPITCGPHATFHTVVFLSQIGCYYMSMVAMKLGDSQPISDLDAGTLYTMHDLAG